jgi:Capsular polysaccharide synthesis protein.
MTEKYKFYNSKIYDLNKKLSQKPYKYIYKEIMPKKLFDKLQKEIYLLNQKRIAKDWDKILDDYFKDEIKFERLKGKKEINNKQIIWQFWGQGWDYEKLPEIVKVWYKTVEKYKGEWEVIRIDMENIFDYLKIPEILIKRLEDKKMGYAHFTDIVRLALLKYYGGVWLDATVILTDFLPQKYFNMDYFVYQRDDFFNEKEKWEKIDSIYFSWDERNKVRFLSSIIFSKKENKVISTLLDMLVIFWNYNNKIPNYFFFQILYTQLIEKYYKKNQCTVISDTLPHELFIKLFQKYDEKEYNKLKNKISIHKLSFKVKTDEKKITGTFLEKLKKEYLKK